MNTHQLAGFRAEARAKALVEAAEARAELVVEEAVARAEAVGTRAEARINALIAEYYRRMQEHVGRTPGMALAPTLSSGENGTIQQSDRLPPPRMNPDLLREVVSVLAYYKAERRGFGPGRETDDWLEAERELVAFLSD